MMITETEKRMRGRLAAKESRKLIYQFLVLMTW